MTVKNDVHFDEAGRFVLEGYSHARPFSSFLPGIAGPLGIPLWVFYVNRGQAIAAFGIQNKDNPIMEFQPANKAYKMTPTVGFPSFIKAANTQADGAHVFDLDGILAGMNELVAAIETIVPDMEGRITWEEKQLPVSGDTDTGESFIGKKTNARFFITPEGRQAFELHLEALEKIIREM